MFFAGNFLELLTLLMHNGKVCITNTCLYTTYQTFITFATRMRLTLIILSMLLLFQSNTRAANVRNRHVIAVKAFVLERKKAEALNNLIPASKYSEQRNLGEISPVLFWDCEEDEDDAPQHDLTKFKLLCGFYLTLPHVSQFVLSYLNPEVATHERFNSQISSTKYIVQRSLRI